MTSQGFQDPHVASFSALADRDPFPFLEAAISIGQVGYPKLDCDEVLKNVRAMLSAVRNIFPSGLATINKIELINRIFYGNLGFGNNIGTAHSPDQVYLHKILKTRRGDSLSQGILWLQLAESVALPAYGIMVADYFVVNITLDDRVSIIIDPLTGSVVDSVELQIMKRVRSRRNQKASDKTPRTQLKRASPKDIIEYLLWELEWIYKSCDAPNELIRTLNRILILQPQNLRAYRARGIALANVGNIDAAVSDLNIFVDNTENVEERALAAAEIASLRQQR